MLWSTDEEIQSLNNNIKRLFEQYDKHLNNEDDTDQMLTTFIDKTSEKTFSRNQKLP